MDPQARVKGDKSSRLHEYRADADARVNASTGLQIQIRAVVQGLFLELPAGFRDVHLKLMEGNVLTEIHAFSTRPSNKDKWMRNREIQELCSARAN